MKKIILCMLLAACALCLSGCVSVSAPADGLDIAGRLEVEMTMNPSAATAFQNADAIELAGEARIYVFEEKDSGAPVLVKNAAEITVVSWDLQVEGNTSVPNIQMEIPYENLEYSTDYFLDLSDLDIQLLKDDTAFETLDASESSPDTPTFTTKAAPSGNAPDGSDPDGSDPDGSDPDGNDPDGSDPDGSDPDGNDPDGNAPDGNAPDGNDPDGSEPDTNQPGSDNTGSEEPGADQFVPDTPKQDPPETGDKSNIVLWIGLAAISLMGFIRIKQKA